MTREMLFDGVQDIFRDIFDEEDMVIEDKTSSDNVEEWDSLNNINLVSAIEKEFEIRFSLGELMALKDVGSMIDLMVEKLK
jgi:acyl carrier protein